MKKILSIFILVTLFAAASCRKAKHSEPGAPDVAEKSVKTEQVFIFNNGGDPEYVDPALASDNVSLQIANNLFEGLTDLDHKNLTPIPGVAKSWEISPDGKTYIFHLRDNAKWSDGSPVTAKDFVYSWQRAASPELASKYASFLFYIKNGEAINRGAIKDLSSLGVKAIDDHTLRVILEKPTPFFLSITNFPTLKPVKKEIVEKYGRRWTRPEHIVSNGYFNLAEWVPQKEIVTVRNPYYWDKQNVFLDKVVYLAIEDTDTSLKSFLGGQIDFMREPPAIMIPSLRNNPEFHTNPQLATYYILTNTKRSPFNNKLFRQALSHAINREQIVKAIHKGIPTKSFTPDDTAGYFPPKILEFNPEKAKKLLAEAGYSDTNKLPPITIYYNTNESHKMIMEMIQNMWKHHLGINVTLLNMEWKVLLQTLTIGDFDISRYSWTGDYVDPNTFLELYTTGNSYNQSGWGNAQYDELINKAASTTDQKKRYDYFSQAETILLDELPILPIYTYTQNNMLSKNVEGFYMNLQDRHPMKGVKILK